MRTFKVKLWMPFFVANIGKHFPLAPKGGHVDLKSIEATAIAADPFIIANNCALVPQ